MGAAMMLAVSLILAVQSAAATSGQVPNRDGGIERRLSRYQSIALRPRPDQRDLLAAVVDTEFGDEIQTVGDAIAALVDGSGYRLTAPGPAPCQARLLDLPLPSVRSPPRSFVLAGGTGGLERAGLAAVGRSGESLSVVRTRAVE